MLNTRVWYQSSVAEVMEALETNDLGLASAEAKERLKKYGHNELKFKKRSALLRLLQQFNSPLIYVLLAAAVITLYLSITEDAKFIVDSGVIFGVVVINAIIGFIQEGKAEASLEMLKSMMVPECTVLRDGLQKTIPTRDLVPGDIVILDEGDRVPADLRLFYAKNLSADEAALTGESVPVSKHIEAIPDPDLSPGDQRNMAFSGTFITRGSGQGIVVGTREQTEIGKIAALIKQTHRAISTPLLRKIADFTKVLLIATLILAAITVGLGVFLGYDLIYSFLASVSLAVAVIPEGLPAVLSIALAAGARAMVHRNVLIRRLPAVETLGSTTVICSDKTGTLTESEMTVARVYCGRKNYKVTGAGYDPTGEFILNGKSINPMQDDDLAKTLAAGFLCNNAALKKEGDRYQISGDPTEGALVVSAVKAGITQKSPILDEIPFESEHRYMATLHQDAEGKVVYVKGSAEKILEMCQMQLVNGRAEPLEREEILRMADAMAKDALRVLGLAYKEVPSGKAALTKEDMNGLIFLGLQGMMDPPRKEAIEAVAKCKKAGIRVIM
ncbi:MAG: HAD-IC family P-type ATPase, partial [Chloroflexi bacterium]|nr:HAD-IC family P-type ATPase [Chloroflexota bacterium]